MAGRTVRKKSKYVKTKAIQVRLTQEEYNFVKFSQKQFQRHFGMKINTSEFLRFCLDKMNNLEFLYNVGYLSYSDFMSSALFHEKQKYPRLKK